MYKKLSKCLKNHFWLFCQVVTIYNSQTIVANCNNEKVFISKDFNMCIISDLPQGNDMAGIQQYYKRLIN